MQIQKVCKLCGKPQMIKMSRESYDAWKKGAHIQDVAPELTPEEREMMISGICGTCYDEMFKEEEY